jgi:hypothetical protein
MALIIEDGSLVANANSYVTVEEARTYAAARGVTLSAVDAEVEQLLIPAMDYLEAQRDRYQGTKVSATQSLQWPRYPVYIDGFLFASDEIPNDLKNAECQLAIEKQNGVDLLPTSEGRAIIKEVVGPLETEYSESVGSDSPTMRAVDNLLQPLYNSGGGGLRTIRV